MHSFLTQLLGTRLLAVNRYGLAVVAVVAMTLVRLVEPLDTASFPLYLPVVFLGALTLALGNGPGSLAVALSDLLAAWFFVKDGHSHRLSTPQVIPLFEYVAVGAHARYLLGVAARHHHDERTLADLERSQAALRFAKEEVDAARTAAEEANKAKSTFLANMSHELRTPLSAVVGYSEMLEGEVEELGEATIVADLGKIKSNAKHLLSLINDVLDLSKVEANRMDVFLELLDVAGFVTDAAATMDSFVQRKGNTLAVDVTAHAGSMRTNIVKLRQCLFDLLSNAANFTEDGRIALIVRREASDSGDWLTFAVSGTGIHR